MTFLLMLCGGCGEIGAPVWGNQIGQASDRGYCDEGAVVGLDEAVPAGFTTRGFFDASGSVDATLFWLGGAWKHPASPTPLTVTFQPAGEPEFRDVGFDSGCAR